MRRLALVTLAVVAFSGAYWTSTAYRDDDHGSEGSALAEPEGRTSGIPSRRADPAGRADPADNTLDELRKLREDLLAEREVLLENDETQAAAAVLLEHVARIDASIAEQEAALEP